MNLKMLLLLCSPSTQHNILHHQQGLNFTDVGAPASYYQELSSVTSEGQVAVVSLSLA